MMRRQCRWTAAVGLVLLLAACSRTEPVAPAPRWSDAWLEAEARAFIDDPVARRRSLEAALTNPANSYSQHRLGSYALPGLGWDLLPAWNPRARVVDAVDLAALDRGEALTVPAAPLWDGVRPTTRAGWETLGREVFFRFPLRAEFAVEHALGFAPGLVVDAVMQRDRRRAAAERGLISAPDGSLPGTVVFRDVDGRTRLGITCALCHTRVQNGSLVVGAARAELDFGALRLAFFDDTGEALDPDLRRRMASWGRGRADVTEDEDEDPVAIPDLWALRERAYLTQAGTITHVGPAALAMRQETQLLHANHQRIRPPRELAWALAMFLYGVPVPPAPPAGAVARGAALFQDRCASCHRDASFGGDALPHARVGTDPALAMGQARGTGKYRVPMLLRIGAGAPYLHDGSVPTLEALFDPGRLREDYVGGARGPGAILGHAFGTELDDVARAELIAFLRSL